MLPDRGETLGARQKTRQRRQRDFENVEQNLPEVFTDDARLDKCVTLLREVLGADVTRDQLVDVALAADCDVNTALDIILQGRCGKNK